MLFRSPLLACLSPLDPLGGGPGGGGPPPCCCANTLPPPVADPGIGVGGKCEYRLGVGGADGVPTACDGVYGVPAVAAVGNGDTGVCGESIEERTPGDGPSPSPYDAERGVVPTGGALPLPANAPGEYGLGLGCGLLNVPDTGVLA